MHGRKKQRDTTRTGLSGAGGSGEGGITQTVSKYSTGDTPAEGRTPAGSASGGAVVGGTGPRIAFVGKNASKGDSKGSSNGDAASAGDFAGNITQNSAGDSMTGSNAAKDNTAEAKPTLSKINSASESGGAVAGNSGSQGNASGTKTTYNDTSKSTAPGDTAAGTLAGKRATGQTTEDTMNQEISEQSHIDGDVFSSGASNRAAAKGLSGGKEISHDPPSKTKSNIEKPKTIQQPSQASKEGASQGVLGQGTNRGGMSQSAYGRGQPSLATTGMTDTSGVQTKRVVQKLNGNVKKASVLQDKVQVVSNKCKTQLGLSASEISQRGPTADTFFDAVAAERLRWMPRDGSRLDCCLRWASRFAYAVDALRKSIGAFAAGADEAARLIWGFEILLLEVRKPTKEA